MRKKITSSLVVALFLSVFSANAQDPQLFNNTWFLENVVINGTDNFPPSNDEVSYVSLDLNNANDFNSHVCNDLFGSLTYDANTPYFTFTFITQTLILCNNTNNLNYEPLYFDFYYNNQNDAFGYDIITNPDTTKTLIITGNNGDQAIYSSSTLSVNKKKLLEIEITTNPVVDVVSIKNKSNAEQLIVKLFNSKGQLIQRYNLESKNDSTLNVQQLTSGLYFLVFESKSGRTLTKKIVKK